MTDSEKLIELLDKTFEDQYKKRNLITAKHTADYLLANGVIALPCKVGDVLYSLDSYVCEEYCKHCEFYDDYYEGCECEKTESSARFHECITIKETVVTRENLILHCINEKAFGKYSFFNREEVEKALAEKKKAALAERSAKDAAQQTNTERTHS